MKIIFLELVFCLFFMIACDTQESSVKTKICTCEVADPATNLLWLAELIEKAKKDKMGNYVGTIWLGNYKGQDIFVTDMMFGSGGIMYWFFDCSGRHLVFKSGEGTYCPKEFIGNQHFSLEDESDFDSFIRNVQSNIVIYSSIYK